jgi:hypothetical protein
MGAVGLGRLESGSIPGRVGGLSSGRRARGALRAGRRSSVGKGERRPGGALLGGLGVGVWAWVSAPGRSAAQGRSAGWRRILRFLVLRGEEQGEGGKVGPARREEGDYPLAAARSRREGEAR